MITSQCIIELQRYKVEFRERSGCRLVETVATDVIRGPVALTVNENRGRTVSNASFYLGTEYLDAMLGIPYRTRRDSRTVLEALERTSLSFNTAIRLLRFSC